MKETTTQIDNLIKESTDNSKILMLYNDNINSFDHVIFCLIKYCKHSITQAEQCAMLVHYKGKCDIKNGSFDEILPIYNILLENKLKVTME